MLVQGIELLKILMIIILLSVNYSYANRKPFVDNRKILLCIVEVMDAF